MTMEWTREKTLALINEYRQRRGLWDMTHDDYRKKDVKHKLLVELSSSLGGGIPIGEIEKKFHTLRTQYHREINRMKRKEPYNSKWFGFKNLQFLSSPMARRLSRGRIKNEITEDGTVTAKYIIREPSVQQHDSSGSSANSAEFLTIHPEPTITIEALGGNRRNVNRSRELEKLIEETTKDVEDIDDKPKMAVRHHHSYNGVLHAEEESHNEREHSEQQAMEVEDEPIESLHLQGEEEDEIAYPSTNGTDGGGSHNQQTVHHGPVPTRIIKIQRRDTCNEAEFYEDEPEPQLENKRIFYESTGQQHSATILASAPLDTSQPSVKTLGNSKVKSHLHKRLLGRVVEESNGGKSLEQPRNRSGAVRDEFTTYGEYVANEMRNITNREVLLGLKHKINTALFEAQMAELQK